MQEIASRDMKLQNILLEDDEARQRPLLKVTGFGHAKVLLAYPLQEAIAVPEYGTGCVLLCKSLGMIQHACMRKS